MWISVTKKDGVLYWRIIFPELLPLTADTSKFDKVFILIEHDSSLELTNQNRLNIYHLRTKNRKFKYNE